MADIELVIKLPEEDYKNCIKYDALTSSMYKAIQKGKLLPKGHGKLIDISKVDEDRIESSNPVISLNINGEYIEAVSLDYLNNLPPIIEAEENEKD